MKFKFSIAKKGFILISVPLVFELIFVSSLGLLLDHSRSDALELNYSRTFVSGISDLTKDFLDLGIALAAYRSTRGKRFVEQYDAIYNQLPAKFDDLEKANASQPRRLAHLEKLKKAGKDLTELTQAFRRPTDSTMVYLLDPLAYRQKVSAAYGAFMDETKAISKEESQLQKDSPGAEDRLRGNLLICIIAGIASSIAVTVALVLFFAKGINQRLSTLTANYGRFAQRESLLPPVGGQDEIAYLDKNFHSMALKLAQAEERKKLYTQMINHDLRAPLAAIQGTLAVTSKGIYGELNEKGAKRIAAAEKDSDRLIGLINEMLDIGSLEDGNLELDRSAFALDELLSEAADAVQALAEAKNIKIESLNDDGQIMLNADKDRLKRVLINLLHNAIKFSAAGEIVTLATDLSGRNVKIMVRDRGPGIKESEAKKLFQPFQQGASGKEQKIGTGLGLAICKAIVEAHDCKIGLDSKPGAGTTFWFYVPKA
jgi:signal transduction histidine kinase